MLSYEVVGSGNIDLLFLHGFAGSRLFWDRQVRAMSPRFRCLSVDLPGHGGSAGTVGSLEEVAGEVMQVLSKESVRQARLVGSSFGGLVALELCRQRPERVVSLSLVGALPRFTAVEDFPAGLSHHQISKLAGQCRSSPVVAMDIFFRSLFSSAERALPDYGKIKELRRRSVLPSLEVLLKVLDLLERADLRETFSSAPVPLQVINGDQDYICPLPAIAALKGIRADLRVDIIKGGGHLPFLSYPNEFTQVLEAFLGL